jgi:uncharacterized repeat protein (TIGR01451 family)
MNLGKYLQFLFIPSNKLSSEQRRLGHSFSFLKRVILCLSIIFIAFSERAEAQCGTPLVFKNPALVSGTALSQGAVYRFNNFSPVFPTYYAELTITNIPAGMAVLSVDDFSATSGGYDDAWQPIVSSTNSGGSHVEWTWSFKQNATTPYSPCFVISTIDNDGVDGIVEEYTGTNAGNAFKLGSNVSSTTPSTGWRHIQSNITTSPYEIPGLDSSYRNSTYETIFNAKSTFTWRTGLTGATTRTFSMVFEPLLSFFPGAINQTAAAVQCGVSSFDPPNITSASLQSGLTNAPAPRYSWAFSNTASTYTEATATQWTTIAGATSTSYNPLVITQTTNYVRLASYANSAIWRPSNVVSFYLQTNVAAAIQTGPYCRGQSYQLTATSTTPSVSYSWTGPNGFTSTIATPTINSATAANSGTYTVTASQGGCTATSTVSATFIACNEICSNNRDDDGDGFIDEADPDSPCFDPGKTLACDDKLYMVRADPGNSANTLIERLDILAGVPTLTTLFNKNGYQLNALGQFNGFLYAMENSGNILYRIDAYGTIVNLGVVANLPTPITQWSAGTIDRNGNYYIMEGASSPNFRLYKIPLLPGGSFTATQVIGSLNPQTPPAGNAINIPNNPTDIVMDENGVLYAFSQGGTAATSATTLSNPMGGLYTINLTTGVATPVNGGAFSYAGASLGSLYVTDEGKIYGYGVLNATQTVVGDPTTGYAQRNFYQIDKVTGQITLAGSSAQTGVGRSDGASCPWRVTLKRYPSTTCFYPGVTFNWEYALRNQSGQAWAGVELRDTLDPRFSYTFNVAAMTTTLQAAFGSSVSIALGNYNGGTNNMLTILGLNVPNQISNSLSLQTTISSTATFTPPSEVILQQAWLKNLPTTRGGNEPSDNPLTIGPFSDKTPVTVYITSNPVVTAASSACLNNAISVSANNIPGVTYAWNFGAGASPATATTLGPHNVSYSTTGSKTISLVVTSTTGCSSAPATTTVNIVTGPSVTLGANPSVCKGTTTANLPYSSPLGSPNQYSINFDFTAEGQGFVDVTNATLGSSPIVLTVPTIALAGIYNATLITSNSTAGCIGAPQNIQVTVVAAPAITLSAIPSVCKGLTSTTLPYSALSAGATQYSIDFDATAEAQGFVDVVNATITASPITIAVPVNGLAATYNGVLTVTNPTTGCVSTNRAITVQIIQAVVANAGADVTNCNSNILTLAANAPAPGSGAWTILAPANGATLSSSTSPTATVNSLGSGKFVDLVWTITTGTCISKDTVRVSNYIANAPACNCNNIYSISGANKSSYSGNQIRILNTATGTYSAQIGGSLAVANAFAFGLDTVYKRFYYIDYATDTVRYYDSYGNDFATGVRVPTGVPVAGVQTIVPYNRGGFNPVDKKMYFISNNGLTWVSYTPTASGSGGALNTFSTLNYLPASAPTISTSAGGGDLVFDTEGNGYVLTNDGQFYKVVFTGTTANIIYLGKINLPTTSLASLAFGSDGKLYMGGTGALNSAGTGFLGSNAYSIDLQTLTTTKLNTLDTTSATVDYASCSFPFYNSVIVPIKSYVKYGSAGVSIINGDTLEYSIKVKNTGNITAGYVRMLDNIPAGTTYVPNSTFVNNVAVTDSLGGFRYAIPGGDLINGTTQLWRSGAINPGDSATIKFRVRVTLNCGQVDNTATIYNGLLNLVTQTNTLTVAAASPSVANAGVDQYQCNNGTFTLAATLSPATATGAWTVIGAANGAFVNTPTSGTSTVSGLNAGSSVTLRWTVTSICSTASDDVVLTNGATPTMTLGTIPSVCLGTTSVNVPYSATTNSPDQYSITFSPAAITAGFVNVANTALGSSPIVVIIPAGASATTYNATLTIRNFLTGCFANQSITVTINPAPTANAGSPVSVCSGSSTVIGTAAIAGHTYAWSPATALSATNVAQPTANPTTGTTYTVTVTNTATGCTNTSSVLVSMTTPPVITLGANPSVCRGITTADLPYTIVSGSPNLYSINFDFSAEGQGFVDVTNVTLSGGNVVIVVPAAAPAASPSGTTYNATITFRNTITGCPSVAQNIQVIVLPRPAVNAGADQTACVSTFTITGNTPTATQTGAWTVVSGIATIASPTTPSTSVTIPPGSSATLRWSVSSATCTATDDVVLNSALANAGEDQTLCAPPSFTMMASVPLSGTGTWTLISGSAVIASINSPTTSVTLPVGTIAILRWTVNTGTCTSFDEITLSNSQSFTANAGPDQAQCANGTTTFTANGNSQAACAASATIVNGSFEAPFQASNTFSLFNESSVLGWKTTAADNMIEFWGTTFLGVPSHQGNQHVELNGNLTSGLFQDLCVLPGDTINWSVAHRGRAGVDNMVIRIGVPGGLVTQQSVSTNNTAWVVYAGGYRVPAGQTVTRFQFEAVSTATGDNTVGNLIDDVKVDLVSRAPIPGVWTLVSGTAVITNPTNPTTSITGVPAGTSATLRWTSSNGVCSSFDDVVYTNNGLPTITLGANPSVCKGITTADLPYSATTFSPNQYSINFDAAAELQGFVDVINATLSSSPIVITVPAGANVGTYNATLIVRNTVTGCIGGSQNITVTVRAAPSVSAVSNQILCSGASTTAVSFTGSAIAGTTYNWTNSIPSIGLAASGTGNIPVFTAVNTGSTDAVATITVTPNANGCAGIPQIFTITVKPIPTVVPVNQVLCNGFSTNAINFTGNISGTTYTWTNSIPSIGLAASGSGNSIPSFVAINAGSTTVTSTIMVTPTANGCVGTPQPFYITVNPAPAPLPINSTNSMLINFGTTTCNNFSNPQFSIIGNPYSAMPPLLANCNMNPPFTDISNKFISYNPKDNKLYVGDISVPGVTRVWVLDVGIQSNITCPTIPSSPTYTLNFQPNNFEFDANGDLWSLSNYNSTTAQCDITKFDEITGVVLATKKVQFPLANPLTGAFLGNGDITILPNGRMFATLGNSSAKLYEITDYATVGGTATAVFLQALPKNTFGIGYINGSLEISGTGFNGNCYYYNYDIASNTLGSERTFQNGQLPIDNSSITPAIGTTKQLVGSTMINNNTADLTYEVYVKNTGNVLLNNINVKDDLAAVYGAANISNVTTSFAVGGNPAGLTLNAAYNGITATDLFNSGQQLINPSSVSTNFFAKVRISLRVTNLNTATTYLNSAIGSGNVGTFNASCGVGATIVADSSNNGPITVIDPNNNGNSGDLNENIKTPFKPLTLSVTKVDVNCDYLRTGTGTVIVSGGTAPFTYAWSSTPTQITAVATNLGVGTYTVTVTDALGVNATAQIVINALNVTPVATASSSATTICNNSSVTLTATGGGTYSWSSGQTTASFSANPAATTTYTVTVTNAASCAASSSVVVTVNPLPTASISGTATICNGGNTNLTAAGGGTYLWSTGATSALINVNPTANTTYTVTVTNASGCTATASQAVTVNPTPTASISGTSTICNGGNTNLTATGGGTYLWSTGATSALINVNPTANATYTVTVTNASGCTATASQAVTVNPLPTASISGTAVICNGGNTNLTASGGGTYLWSTGATSALINVAPSVNATYTVTVTNASGCTATASQAVTVNPVTAATISGTTTICNGGNTTLTASAGASYSWSTGATTASINVSPTANATYTVTVTNASGCISTASQLVTVNPVPTASISGTSTICNGGNTNLTASGGGTYLWSTGATSALINVAPSVNTTYTVTVTSASGCTATASQAVTITPLPTLTAITDKTLCAGDASTAINFTGAATINWTNSNPAIGLAASGTGNIGSFTAINTGTLPIVSTVTVTPFANGCNGVPVIFTITVNPLPTATISGTAIICSGNSSTLTAAGGGTYSWSTGETTAAISVSPTANATYTVTVTNASGCTATAVQAITVNPVATASISGATTLCVGNSTPLTASGGGTYLWSTGATSALISVNPIATATYTVTVTNASGCTATASRVITVNPTPTITLGSNPSVCKGITTTNLTYSGTTGSPDLYLINFDPTAEGSGFVDVINAPLTSSPIVITVPPGASSGTYNATLVVKNSVTGCPSVAQNIQVIILAKPIANAGSTVTICSGVSTTLGIATVAGNTYAWSPATGLSSASIAQPVATPLTTTTYTVTVTNGSLCSATSSVIVNVNPTPVVVLSPIPSVCRGTTSTTLPYTVSSGTPDQYSITFNAAAITAGFANVTNAALSSPITITVPAAANAALYNATITFRNSTTGCVSVSQNIIVRVDATVTATIATKPAQCNNGTFTLGANSAVIGIGAWSVVSPASYALSNISSVSLPTATASNVPTGTPVVLMWTVTNGACSSSSTVTLVNDAAVTANAGPDAVVCSATSYTLTPNTPSVGTGVWTVVSGSGTVSGNVLDLTQNLCTPATQATGNLNRDIYSSIGGGTSINDLTTAAIYPNSPSITNFIPQYSSNGYANDNYGTRVRGYIRPTVTGNYTFVITGDDAIDFYLSTDANPANKVRLAYITGWTNVAEFTKYPTQTSVTVSLVAGQNYYTELLHKEGSSGDNFQVYWKTPSNSVNTIIPGTNLVPFCTPQTTLRWTVSNGSCIVSDDVIVTNSLPVTANAGSAVAICVGSNTTLGVPAVAGNTYAWSPATGLSSATIAQPVANPTVTTTYTVTVTNSVLCTATSSVVVTVNPLPIVSLSAIPSVCRGTTSATLPYSVTSGSPNQYSITFNAAAITAGFANVTNASLSSPILITVPAGANAASYNATITFRNSTTGCSSVAQNIIVRVDANVTATVAAKAAQCNNGTFTLGANVATPGIGAWSVVSPASYALSNISSVSSPTASATNVPTGTPVTLMWTVTNGACSSSSTVTLVNDEAVTANAGADVALCNASTTYTLTPNTPSVGTGVWTIMSGSGTISGNVLDLTQNICTPATQATGSLSREIYVSVNGTSINNLISAPAYPNSPNITNFIPQYSSNGYVSDNYGTRVRGYIRPTVTGNYTFVITGDDAIDFYLSTNDNPVNKVRLAYITGSTNVTEFTKYPTQTSVTVSLTAGQNYYTELLHKEGSGGDNFQVYWQTPLSSVNTIVPGANLAPFCTPQTTLRWTVTNGSCIATDDVVVTNSRPVTANAGPDQESCGSTFTLAATVPSEGTGVWTIVSGPGTITTNSSINTTVTNVTLGASTVLRWTVTNGACSSFDEVTIKNTALTLTAGGGVTYCPGMFIQFFANVNDPVIRTNGWNWSGPASFASLIQNAARPNALPNMGGTYTVTYNPNRAGCPTATATTTVVMSIVNRATMTAKNLGPYCIGQTIVLDVDTINTTPNGIWTWTLPDGSTRTGKQISIPNATTAMNGNYTVQYALSGCDFYSSTVVQVRANPTATATNTGPFCYDANINLFGNGFDPSLCTDVSNLVVNGDFNDANAATRGFTSEYNYTSSAGWGNYFITNSPNVIWSGFASACPDHTTGTGNMLIADGINTPNSYVWQQNVTAVEPNKFYKFSVWVNNLYTRSYARIRLTVNGQQVGSTLEMNYPLCQWIEVSGIWYSGNSTTADLRIYDDETSGAGNDFAIDDITFRCNAPAVNGSKWVWSGPNGFSSTLQNPVLPNATPINSGIYTLVHTSVNGCTAAATTTLVIVKLSEPVSFAGLDKANCNSSTFIMTAQDPAIVNDPLAGPGTGVWVKLSGPGTITSPTNYSTTVTGIPLDATSVFEWTVTRGTCVAKDTVTLRNDREVTSSAGSSQAQCNNGSFNISTSTPSVGTGSWSIVSGSGTITAPNSISTTVTGVSPNTTTLVRWTVINGACSATSDITLTNNALPTPTITGTSAICIGGNTNLTAAGGGTYLWSTGATSALINVAPSVNATYTVTVTNANGCTATASQAVTVNPLPTPTITGTSVICNGGNTNLTAAGGGTYLWSTGATTALINVSPTANATYTVTVTNSNGCTATASQAVTVNPLPTASIIGTSVICNGGNTNLTATGGGTYLWSTGATSALINVAPSVNATYTVTVTNSNGCTATASQAVTVNPLPTASITGTSVICNGGSTTLTAAGGATYSWNTGATTAALTVSPTTNTTYTVTITDANGCTATASQAVSVNQLPVANTVSNQSVCHNTTASVNFSGTATTYNWTNDNTTIGLAASGTGNIASFTAINTGTANVVATITVTPISNGCSGIPRIFTITVKPLPTVPTLTAQTICAGQSSTQITLSTSGVIYNWTNDNTAIGLASTGTGTISSFLSFNTGSTPLIANIVVTPISNGCVGLPVSTTITVNPRPTASITGTAIICSGGTTTLTAAGGVTYAWSNGATTATNTVSPTANTTYTVTVTNSDGCTATASQAVTINSTPTVNINGTSTVCEGTPTTITATGGGTYLWNTTATTAGITVTPLSTTTYTVTVTNASGCTSTASRTVTVNPKPVVNITGTTTICNGISTQLTATGGGNYLWSTGSTAAFINISPTTTTTYTVTVTNASGCITTASQAVTVNPTPTASITGTATICNGNSTTLTAAGVGTYAWSTTETTAAITVNPTATTTYTVTVTNASGCTSTASRTVTVNPTPTASISGISILCNGLSGNITAAGGGTYAWSSTSSTAATITVNPTTTTTYTVTVTNASGCTSTASRTVTVNPTPTASITGISTICSGTSTQLTAAGVGTYLWSTNETTADITVSPASTATYTVTVTNASNCTATASQVVTVNPTPSVSVAPSAANYCSGTTITLNGTLISGNNTGATWSWAKPDGGAALTGQNPTRTSSTVAMAGVYTVTFTQANGCSATATATVNVTQQPAVTIGGGNQSLCNTGTFNLNATAPAVGTGQWQWVRQSAATISDVNNRNAIISGVVAGDSAVLYWRVTNGLCFANSANIILKNLPRPTAAINASTTSGCPGTSITFTAGSVASGVTYGWTFGASGSVATATGANPAAVVFNLCTTQSVRLIATLNGCKDTAFVNINTNDTINPVFSNRPANVTAECDAIPPMATNVTATDNCGVVRTDAFETSTYACDTATYFNGLNAPVVTSYWNAEGRIGDIGAATYETDFHRPSPFATIGTQGQAKWYSGIYKKFTYIYNPNAVGADRLTYVLDNDTTNITLKMDPASSGPFALDFDALRVTMTSNSPNGTVAMDNVYLNGLPLTLPQASVTGVSRNVLATGWKLNQGFVLTGRVAMSWTGTMPSQSALNYNFSVGKLTTPCVADDCKQQNYIISRTWVAEDGCKNTVTATQIINVQDTKVPTFVGLPSNTTLECGAIPAVANVTAMDNCDPTPTVTYMGEVSTQTTNGTCTDRNYTLTRTWSVADNCGNSTLGNQIITVIAAPLVDITPSTDSICEGGVATITSVLDCKVGTNQTYQWQQSDDGSAWVNVAAGGSSANYTASGLTETTFFRLVVTQGACTAYSDLAVINVTPTPSVLVAVDDATICVGGSTVLTATVTGGVGSTTYQWQQSSNGTTGWGNISLANSSTYTTPALSVTRYYRMVITQTGGGCTQTSTATAVNVVNDPTVTTQPAGFTECIGGTLQLSVVATGGTPLLVYQWEQSADGVSGWTDVAAATSNVYTPNSTVTGTFYYRLRASATGVDCATAYSNPVTVVIAPDPEVQVTVPSTTVCTDGQVILTASPTGGTGTCTVQWQSKLDTSGTWLDVPGATGNTYQTNALKATSNYRAVMSCSGNGCCN